MTSERDASGSPAEKGEGKRGASARDGLRNLALRGSPRIAVIGIAALILSAVAASAVFLRPGDGASVVEIDVTGSQLVYSAFPEIVADLRPEGSVRRHAKLAVVVELPEALRPQLEASRPAVLDALNAYLREQRAEDLVGAEGAARVRAALTRIINDALAPGSVKTVLFREFILS